MKTSFPNRLLLVACVSLCMSFLPACFHHTSAPPPAPQPVYVMPPPPPWAPPYRYQDRVRYYYIPDMECYYDVYMGQYVYYNGFEWIHSPYAPTAYSSYDMYTGSVIVLNYGVNDPWLNHNTYVTNYPRGYNGNSSASGPRGGANTGSPTSTGHSRGFDENNKTVLYEKNANKNVPLPPNATPGPDKTPHVQNQLGTPKKSNNEPQPALNPPPAKHKQPNEEPMPLKEPVAPVRHSNPAPNPPRVEPIENHQPKPNKPVNENGPRNAVPPKNAKKAKDGNGGY
jgi:hypothetical protein